MAGTSHLDELNAIDDAEDLPNTSTATFGHRSSGGGGGGRAGSYQQRPISRRSCSVGDNFANDYMLNAMFRAADEDGDGLLSRDELKEFFKSFRSIDEAIAFEQILDEFDGDANDKLDQKEFGKFFYKKLHPVLEKLKLNKVLALLGDIELNEKKKKRDEATPKRSAFSRCCSGRLKECARRLHLQNLWIAEPNNRTDALTSIGGYHDLTSKYGSRRFKAAVQDHLDEWARDKLEKHENERNRDGTATRNQGEIGVHDLNVQQLIDKAGNLGALSDNSAAPKQEQKWQKKLRNYADEIRDPNDSQKQEYKNQAIQLIQHYLLRQQTQKDKELEEDLQQVMDK